jgi:hypothetical protein
MTIQLLRLGCLLRGHEWAAVQWNARGVPLVFCCLRCFKEKRNEHHAPPRPLPPRAVR